MKTTILRISALLVASAAFTGCSHNYYSPITQQVPMFTEKNQWQAAGSASFGEDISATDIGVAYSAGSHVAVMGDVNWMRGTWSSNNNYVRSGYAEAAVGYFSKIDKYGVFELYGGVGRNGQHHQYGSDTVTANLAYTKLFIQPVIGFKKGHIEAGFSFRISQLNYTRKDVIGTIFDDDRLPDKTSYTLIEPAFTFRVGGDNVKFQFQRQLSSPMTFDKPKWQYTPSLWSFGVRFAFGTSAPE